MMATVSKAEGISHEVMTAYLAGDAVEYRAETVTGHAWRCDGCGLVWEKRWHADKCEERGHVRSFEQGPYGVQYVENGKPVGRLRWYTRSAIRRDSIGRD